ncbi:E3 ubiquitin-protein ligase PUB22-like [Magnolia sinica]|uniref:E3 ubiquitin-protein ligase PUB22-like n=1 Tax=Magnolia sinica TaxID=86752 RepID=UPI00265AA1AD|nr:E3 ubiquitin-protein ligase PUB22-like [Magnolia sinica]
MEVPMFFRCPISMELMQDPVTISTGVSYEKKNIERWFFHYKKKTCPATMQLLESFDLTPNHTLKRLILSWQDREAPSLPFTALKHGELTALLRTVESTPFKVRSLKKIGSMFDMGDEIKAEFIKLGGIDVLGRIIFQILLENYDFATFRACEEALSVLHRLPLFNESSVRLLSKPECVKSMAVMLQRGSAETRLHTVMILREMVKIECDWGQITSDLDMDIFKSLLELLSDEIYNKASSCALDVLIEIVGPSRKNRVKSVEAGAVCILIELLPDSNRPKCEKMLFLLKMLCECAEGRLALSDHRLAVAVISKKIQNVSELATKLGVKILWLVCSFHQTKQILEEMLVFGAVKKLVGLLHINGESSTKEKAMKIVKLHEKSWRQYPCFPWK